MTIADAVTGCRHERRRSHLRFGVTRRFVMCRPTHFDVVYAINPWMDVDLAVDTQRALEQWTSLRDQLSALGHRVDVIDPPEALPDLVFAANAGIVIGDIGLGARFRNPERQPESAIYEREFAALGVQLDEPSQVNEGEGDVLVHPASKVGNGMALAGYGPRSERDAHDEIAAHFGIELVSLRLVDDRFYHLDTACNILDDRTVAYYPGAFDEGSRRLLESTFDRAIVITDDDAAVLGANVISDGTNVLMSDRTPVLSASLQDAGFRPLPLAMDEFTKSGGGPHCCVLECF